MLQNFKIIHVVMSQVCGKHLLHQLANVRHGVRWLFSPIRLNVTSYRANTSSGILKSEHHSMKLQNFIRFKEGKHHCWSTRQLHIQIWSNVCYAAIKRTQDLGRNMKIKSFRIFVLFFSLSSAGARDKSGLNLSYFKWYRWKGCRIFAFRACQE